MIKGFFRNQEENIAIKLLKRQYEREKRPIPETAVLKSQAERIVDEAHAIARQRSRNVLAIINDLVSEVRKK